MQPHSPVLTEEFVPAETVYAKDQPEYIPLPAIRNKEGVVLTRWKLSDEEREAIALGADILLRLHTFNTPLQPIQIEVACCTADLVGIATQMGLL